MQQGINRAVFCFDSQPVQKLAHHSAGLFWKNALLGCPAVFQPLTRQEHTCLTGR